MTQCCELETAELKSGVAKAGNSNRIESPAITTPTPPFAQYKPVKPSQLYGQR
jgi:hypothetical protein